MCSSALSEKWEPFKSIVENSNIEFGKFGWVSEVADLLNIKPQKVNGWMKRYLLTFTKTNVSNEMPVYLNGLLNRSRVNGVNVGSSPSTGAKFLSAIEWKRVGK